MQQWTIKVLVRTNAQGEYEVKATILDLNGTVLAREAPVAVHKDATTNDLLTAIRRRCDQWFFEQYPTIDSLPNPIEMNFGFPDVLITGFYS